MLHRVFDEMARLRRRLTDIDAEIAAVLAATVVDLADLRDLRNTRGVLQQQLAAKEKLLHDED